MIAEKEKECLHLNVQLKWKDESEEKIKRLLFQYALVSIKLSSFEKKGKVVNLDAHELYDKFSEAGITYDNWAQAILKYIDENF